MAGFLHLMLCALLWEHANSYVAKATSGTSEEGDSSALSGYITYLEGSFPVVIAAPHGGYREPDHIPDRDAGCWDGSQCVYSHDCGDKNFDR